MRYSGTYDLLVVGGGINGAGIARDAAGRGLSVLLCEQDDLAAHTSSASTKLIHGGLRYLEQLQFSLVRKALIEREILLGSAPHLMRPLRFVLPHDARQRPAWMISAGLFLYDHLARRRRLAGSARVDLRRHVAGAALKTQYVKGFVYSDGWTDDARLVVLNAIDARERGALILTRTRCEKLEAERDHWVATLAGASGPQTISARAVVNATGPWVSRFAREAAPVSVCHSVRLVKGSHIVVPQLYAHRFAYLFQNDDRRIVFAIPYEREFTLIGTTDVEYTGDPSAVRIASDEIEYLCAAVSRYFAKPVRPDDVVWSYSGVRPLLDDDAADPATVTRDYALELEQHPAPILNVFGGKITTYRKLAESAVDILARELGSRASAWTAHALLPGGDLPRGNYARFLRSLERAYPWLPPTLRYRYAHAYGTRVAHILGGARSVADLGEELLPQLYEREADYLCYVEMAQTAEDILWRRTRLGLHVERGATGRLQEWLARRNSHASGTEHRPVTA
ncbi:MAG TPA: glycerol-3-phosphate dehydrogenase [Steroidobacteraceae bacterium]|jgi:glycerol-3-phosphate dehydrogenase|nr:glycerol-3-phosphate dehydrogenase [Steroidobacteraceae bacterium]